MADEKRGVRVEGAISPRTIAWFLLGSGLLLLFWKLLDTLSAGADTAKDLSKSIQDEAEEAKAYVASEAYNDAGLEIRKIALNDKLIALQTLSQNWLTRTLDSLTGWLRSFGIYVVWPGLALIASYLIYKLVKNWPKGGPPTFRCHLDGLEFPTKEALDLHNSTQHTPQSNLEQLNSAWATFREQPTFVQDAIALEFVSSTKVYQSWSSLTPQEVANLATAIETAIAYGIGMTLQTLIPVLLW